MDKGHGFSTWSLSKDEQAVLDHVSGLTRVLPEPEGLVCEDREYVGELVAMRSVLGGMAIQPPKMRLTFDDILKSAETEQRQPTDNRIIYWLTGRWGIGLVTAASVALAFMTGLVVTAEGRRLLPGVWQSEAGPQREVLGQFPKNNAPAPEHLAEPKPPAYRDGALAGDISLYGSIARTGTIQLRHEDPARVQQQVTELVTSSGGIVTNLTRQGTGDVTNVSISMAVPADKYREFKGKVAGYGEVLNEDESTEDVTGEQVDFKARLAEAEEYLARLDKLSETPNDLSSLQNLERERRNTRLEIERYRKAVAALESRVALSRLDVTISTAAPAAEPAPEPRGELAQAWHDGLEGLEAVSGFLIRAGLAGSPFLVIGAIAYTFLRRKRKQLERNAA